MMRLSVVFMAAAIGSAMSIASAQTTSVAGLAKASATMVAPPSGGGLLAGGADDCNAADVIGGSGSFFFDNSLATTGAEGQSESVCYEFGTTAMITDVWFDWTSDFDGLANVDTCGSPTDTKIAAYPGAGCPTTGTALDCNDDNCGWQSAIQFPVVNGQTYAIQVGLYPFASGGTGMLNIAMAPPPPECPVYHTGVSNNALGLTAGGDACYMVYIDCMTQIYTIEVAFGSGAYPGTLSDGLPATLAIWDDPTNDSDPTDAILLATFPVAGGTVNACTDIMNSYATGGIAVTGGVFIGAVVAQPVGEYAAVMDQTVSSNGLAWWAGNTAYAFDFNVLTNNDVGPSETASIGFDTQWLIHCTGALTGEVPFEENFDSYPLGALEGNTNASGATWHGWGGSNTYVSQVSNAMASSAPNSAMLPIGTDSIMDFDEMTDGNPMVAGQWRMTAEIYVTGNYDGQMYYIVLNEYSDPGPYEWAVQVAMDATTGQMTCDCGTAGTISSALLVDQWVELRWDIDLDGDNVDFYYAGNLIASYPWSGGVFGGDNYANLKVDSIDLFPAVAETAGEVYLDNIKLMAIDGGPTGPGIAYCPGDGVDTPCPCGNSNDGSMSGCDWMGGNVAGGALDATGSDVFANTDTFLEATNVSGDFGVFFSANGQVTGRTLADGIRCAGFGLIRMTPPTAPGGSTATHAVPLQLLDGGAGMGITRHYQYWFRTDPGQCGNLANTTNGYSITWM